LHDNGSKSNMRYCGMKQKKILWGMAIEIGLEHAPFVVLVYFFLT